MKDKSKFFPAEHSQFCFIQHQDTYFRVMWGEKTSRKVQRKVAEVVCAAVCHIIERLSVETCCFCRILWVPVKEMTQWYKAGAHSWSSLITHTNVRGSRSSILDSRLSFWVCLLADATVQQQHFECRGKHGYRDKGEKNTTLSWFSYYSILEKVSRAGKASNKGGASTADKNTEVVFNYITLSAL